MAEDGDEKDLKGKLYRDVSSEQLITSFYARQESPAYQYMLVSSTVIFNLNQMTRTIYVKAQRNTLPIALYRQHIVEMLEMSQVVVLSGETGW